jgi:hypothetical protein
VRGRRERQAGSCQLCELAVASDGVSALKPRQLYHITALEPVTIHRCIIFTIFQRTVVCSKQKFAFLCLTNACLVASYSTLHAPSPTPPYKVRPFPTRYHETWVSDNNKRYAPPKSGDKKRN